MDTQRTGGGHKAVTWITYVWRTRGGHKVSTWRTQGGRMQDKWQARFGVGAKAGSRDASPTHGGHADSLSFSNREPHSKLYGETVFQA